MGGLIIRWLAVFLAVVAAGYLFPDRMTYADYTTAAVFATILALINAFIRPILSLLALPLTCLTFGLFAIVINAFTFWLATQLVPGVVLGGTGLTVFVNAVIASLVVSVVSAVINRILR
ncbi:MAG: phage holin family protein [Chloroflexota bacterium]